MTVPTVPPFNICTKCATQKPFTDFTKESRNKTGLSHWCKECQHEYHTTKKRALIEKQTCIDCGKEKLIREFNKASRFASGYSSRCAACTRTQLRGRRQKPSHKAYMAELALRPKNVPDEKTCTKCKEMLPASSFYIHRYSLNGLSSRCKPCARETDNKRYDPTVKAKRKTYVEEYKASERGRQSIQQGRLKHYFGLTVERYEEMLNEQNGLCKICQRPPTGKRSRLSVDHCHETGVIRGLLCSLCNSGLGFFQDNPERLLVASEYLNRHRTPPLGS